MHYLFDLYLSLSKEYPAVIGAFSIWLLGALSFFGRNIPTRLIAFIRQKFVYCITIDESYGGVSRQYVAAVCNFIERTVAGQKIKASTLIRDRETETASFIMGDGAYSFWYKRRYVSVFINTEKLELESYRKIRITTYGWAVKHFDVMKEFILQSVTVRPRQVYKYNPRGYDDNWTEAALAPDRNLESVVYADNSLEKVIEDIEKWRTQRDYYDKFNIPYKKAYVLEGPPGTGKTSFVQAVASYFHIDIYTLSLSAMNDEMLGRTIGALSKTPTLKLLIVEDFDSLRTLHDRDSQVKDATSDKTSVTLQGYLNCFGGVVPLTNILIFMTANRLSSIDPAVIRPGRVDKIIHIGLLTDKEIRKYISYRYDDIDTTRLLEATPTFADMTGGALEVLFLETLHHPKEFISRIPTK